LAAAMYEPLNLAKRVHKIENREQRPAQPALKHGADIKRVDTARTK
jgi:hypothetical protein